MSGPAVPSRLAVAQARALIARARFSATIGQLQERARPTSLVHDVTETLKERGADLALGMVDTVKRKPARAGAVLALVGLVLARHQVAGLVRSAAGAVSRRSPATPSKGKAKP